MTNMYIVAFLSAWAILAMFALAFIRGADERRTKPEQGSTELGVEA